MQPFASRLDKLLDLRKRLDDEIAEERERQARIERTRSLTFKAQNKAARRQMRDAGRQREIEERAALLAKAPSSVVRAWARENGVPVGERGQVGVDVYEAYAEALVDAEAATSNAG